LRIATPAVATALVAAMVFATSATVPSSFKARTASDLRAPTIAHPASVSHKVAAPPPLRVMLVGDSMATSMAPGLDAAARANGFTFWDASVPGCGLGTDVGDRWFAEWRGVEPRCLPGWKDRWPGQVAAFHPDVVVGLFGAQDAFDRRIAGNEIKFDTDAGIQLAQQDMEGAVSVLSASGAKVIMLTTPYYTLGWPQKVDVDRSPLHEPWIDRYNNDVVRAVAARHPDTMSVIDLNRYLDPAGTWTDTVNGIKVRSFDRCHLSELGSNYVAWWLAPQILTQA
jgi:hypothetical protein